MKKLILIFFALFLFSPFFSQSFRGGVIGGFSLNQIDGDTYGGYDKAGIIAGLVVDRKFSTSFSMSMDFKYIQKGSRAVYNIETQTGEHYLVRLHYFSIPILAQYLVWNHFYAETGLGFSYLIDFKEEDNNGQLPSPHPFDTFETAFVLGVGYDMPEKNLRFSIRSSNSIFPIRKNIGQISYYYDANAVGQYNRNLEFNVIWFF